MIDSHEIWIPIEDFYGYEVSSYGQVRNISTGKILVQSRSSSGSPKVGLFRDGAQLSRMVNLLVANAFVSGRSEIFNTPINLDGNRLNNEATNLMWRPRWFVVNYTLWFRDGYSNENEGPIHEIETGLMYNTVKEAAIATGTLPRDLFGGCLNGEPVFPTWHHFEYLNGAGVNPFKRNL